MDTRTAPQILNELILGGLVSQAISVAVDLGIPDALAHGRATAEEISRSLDTDRDATNRLLRALCDVGVFDVDEHARFGLTELGALLRRDAPQSLGPWAQVWSAEFTRRAWWGLEYSVRTGKPAFDEQFGMPLFEYLSKNPKAASSLDAAMTATSQVVSSAVVSAYDFGSFSHIVDVGGGNGFLLASTLKASPDARGTLLDLPHVIHQAPPLLAREGVQSRCTLVEGNFFEAVPSGGGIYLLKYVLHDWSDDDCVRILANCRKAMQPGAKVLIVERALGSANATRFARFADLNMLVITRGGRERTFEEFASLLGQSGFAEARLIPTPRVESLIEGTAA